MPFWKEMGNDLCDWVECVVMSSKTESTALFSTGQRGLRSCTVSVFKTWKGREWTVLHLPWRQGQEVFGLRLQREMFSLHFRKDGSVLGGAGMDPQVMVFQTSLDKPLSGYVGLLVGPREDKLRPNHISMHALVVLHMLEQNTLTAATTMLLLHISILP